MSELLGFSGVSQRFPDNQTLSLPDWSLQRGEHCLIMGPSGSGKTTMLSLAAGLLTADAGRITLDQQPLHELGEAQRDRLRARCIGLVFQTLHLVSALSVGRNLALAQYLAGQAVDWDRIRMLLTELAVDHLMQRKPDTLSQGQAQRVAIARATVTRPQLVLADEPTAALDDRNCERTIELLLSQAQACGASLVIATHDQRLRPHIETTIELDAPT